MADYLEVVQFKERNGKWRATKLGYAKKNDKGQLNVYLDALPLPDHEGQVRFVIQKPQERSEGQGDTQQVIHHQAPTQGGPQLEDDVPFMPEVR